MEISRNILTQPFLFHRKPQKFKNQVNNHTSEDWNYHEVEVQDPYWKSMSLVSLHCFLGIALRNSMCSFQVWSTVKCPWSGLLPGCIKESFLWHYKKIFGQHIFETLRIPLAATRVNTECKLTNTQVFEITQ